MRITKRQLRRIIKEERTKILKEQSRDRVSIEGRLLGELMAVIGDLATIEKELYGLTDDGGEDMGSVYGEELNATIDELDAWREKLTVHFESMDPENQAPEEKLHPSYAKGQGGHPWTKGDPK